MTNIWQMRAGAVQWLRYDRQCVIVAIERAFGSAIAAALDHQEPHEKVATRLFPPNQGNGRDSVYSIDSREVAHDVREWAIAHGDNPMLRIAYCSYGEEPLPKGWVRMRWKANGGHGNASADGRGRRNAKLETIDFSPHCLHPNQLPLFKEV